MIIECISGLSKVDPLDFSVGLGIQCTASQSPVQKLKVSCELPLRKFIHGRVSDSESKRIGTK